MQVQIWQDCTVLPVCVSIPYLLEEKTHEAIDAQSMDDKYVTDEGTNVDDGWIIGARMTVEFLKRGRSKRRKRQTERLD